MAEKARHAYGSRQNVDSAIAANKIDAYDILFLSGENESPTIGWVDKNGKAVIVEDKNQVVRVETLPTSDGDENVVYVYNNECYIWDGEKCIPIAKSADLTELENKIETKVDETKVQEMINSSIESVVDVVEF